MPPLRAPPFSALVSTVMGGLQPIKAELMALAPIAARLNIAPRGLNGGRLNWYRSLKLL
jgi:hypothetical protein